MLNRRIIGLLALLLSAGLTFSACGDDDDKGETPSNNNNGKEEPEPDAGGEDTKDPEPGDPDTTEEGDTTDPGEISGCTSNDECADGYECNTDTNQCVALPTGCDQTGDDRPERCDVAPADVEFGPASYTTTFKIADEDCCFNLDGNEDDEVTNQLGFLLGFLEGTFDDPNESIQDTIEEGSLVLLFEHDGLTDLESGEPYNLNVWLGEPVDSPDPTVGFYVDPLSIDQGSFPQASLPNAKIENGVLTAGPGTVNVSIALPGILDVPLDLQISMAQIEAKVDMDQSSVEDGVFIADENEALQGGKLGGVIRLTEVVNAVNGFADTCGCIDFEDDFLVYDEDLPEDGVACTTIKENNCDKDEEAVCHGLPQACTAIGTIGKMITDVDTNGDGSYDSTSVGITFDTVGTEILGFGD